MLRKPVSNVIFETNETHIKDALTTSVGRKVPSSVDLT